VVSIQRAVKDCRRSFIRRRAFFLGNQLFDCFASYGQLLLIAHRRFLPFNKIEARTHPQARAARSIRKKKVLFKEDKGNLANWVRHGKVYLNISDHSGGVESTTNTFAPETKRRLGLFDALCLGWNSVIGSGIFLTQGQIAASVGSYGPLLFLLGGLTCLPVALCFGEMARRYQGTGGSSLYAHRAFGPWAGFAVGWVMWMSGLIGGATVSVGLATHLTSWVGNPGPGLSPVAAAIVVALAAINLTGSRSGAWSNNLLAIGKLLPILAACAVGLALVGPAATLKPTMIEPAKWAWQAGLLAVLYTYSGYEEIALPAGEVKRAEVVIPRAAVLVVLTSALLYTVLQGIVSSLGVAGEPRPLEAAFRGMPFLAAALAVAALLSYASVNASIAFTTPRSLWTLAHLGWLPAPLKHLSHGAPQVCILISAGLTLCLIFSQTLDKLIALSVLASLLQHLSTSFATWKLRGWKTRPGVPHLAVAVSLLLLATSEMQFIVGMALSLLMALSVAALTGRRSGVEPEGPGLNPH
jgi:basic amino acid/polyamine antiporter, APA family